MTKAEEQLCIQITLCPNTGNKGKNGINPCDKILKAQNCTEGVQMPEPWSGHLSSAKILYIGSNPSIDCDEVYPDYNWSKKQICDFFENRFKNGKVLKSTGKRDSVNYWTGLVTYTNMINELKGNIYYKGRLVATKNANGWDYSALDPYVACTEIVHCKSIDSHLLNKGCKQLCFNKWMPQILSLFTGDLIVLVGNKAHYFESQIQLMLNGRNVQIVLAPYTR